MYVAAAPCLRMHPVVLLACHSMLYIATASFLLLLWDCLLCSHSGPGTALACRVDGRLHADMCTLSHPHIFCKFLRQHIHLCTAPQICVAVKAQTYAALQSRSELASECENILDELTHQMITMAKGAAMGAQGPHPLTDVLTYSKHTLTRLSRYAMQLPNLASLSLNDMARLDLPSCQPM